jgi:acetyltransferase-like isoleucine patch superfamily enzyme
MKKILLSNSILVRLLGRLYQFSIKNKYHLLFGNNVLFGRSNIVEGRNLFGHNSIITSSSIGYASYIAENSKIVKTKIGRYTSIGPNVKVILGNHPSHTFVSTHPTFFSTRKQVGFSYTKTQLFPEFAEPRDIEKKYSVIIGNDVWIGAGVMIIDGIEIGDGAIIAAGAVVTKDIAPYSIVGGVPARVIKHRFNESQIAFLLKFKWWEKDHQWLQENYKYFSDIDHFIRKFGRDAN